MIYVVVFLLSILFLQISLNYRKRAQIIFTALSMFFPCLLAALRGSSVGIDMQIYIIRFFNLAVKSDSFRDYVKLVGLTDYLYLAINYFISRFTNLLWIELFIQQALVIVPIYIALFRIFENKKSIILGMCFYFLSMYNFSLNISRQSIALAFGILGFSYLGKENKKYILYVIVATLFHNSAVIMAIPFIVFKLLDSKYISRKLKIFISFSLSIGCILFIYLLSNLLPLLANSNYTFLRRIAGYTRFLREEIDISISGTILCLVCVFFTFLYRNKLRKFCSNSLFFPVLALLGAILYQTGNFITYSQRASYYFLYPVIFIALPSIVSEDPKLHGILHPQRWILFFFISWWIFNILISNSHRTLPYVFFFNQV